MPAIVFTLAETTDRIGTVLGVFADRQMAIDAALSWARHRAQQCRAHDAKTFGDPGLIDTYQAHLRTLEHGAEAFVIYTPNGERDHLCWHVSPFEVIKPTVALAAGPTALIPTPV